MRVVFMGTSAFALPVLTALAERADIVIPAVYTQPPRKAGRGHKFQRTAVHETAESLGLEVRTPTSLKRDDAAQAMAAHGADLALVASYGLLLPPSILALPRHGCVNIHASILPRWRGASPIQQAILHGDAATGVDFFQMERGLDTGPVLLRQTTAITPTDTGGSLHDRLAALAAAMLPEFLERLAVGSLTPMAQPDAGVTHAPKIGKSDGIIDWRRPAAEIERMIRAFDPWPGAWTHIGEERLRLWQASVQPGHGPPGQLIEAPLRIATGEGLLEVQTVQRAGRKPMSAQEFRRGFELPPGQMFGA